MTIARYVVELFMELAALVSVIVLGIALYPKIQVDLCYIIYGLLCVAGFLIIQNIVYTIINLIKIVRLKNECKKDRTNRSGD